MSTNKIDWRDLLLRYVVTAIVAIIFAILSWLIPTTWVETNFNLWGGVAVLALVIILSAFIVFTMNFVMLKKRDDNSKSIFSQHSSLCGKHSSLCDNCLQNNNMCKEKVDILNGLSDRLKIHSSIIDYASLADIEKNVPNGKIIYIFTSEFKLEEEMLKEIIKNNFAKNITYKYIIPQRVLGEFKENVKEWEREGYSNLRKLLECYVVPDNYSYMTVLAYGTKKINNYDIVIKLTGGETSAKLYPYMILLDKDDDKDKQKYMDWFHTFTADNKNGTKSKYWTNLWN